MADHEKSHDVSQAVGKIMETQPPNIGWMEGELAHKLLAAFNGGRTLMFMQLMREGLEKPEAEEQVSLQLPLLAFDLGMKIGKEMQEVQQMRDLFGDTPPEFP